MFFLVRFGLPYNSLWYNSLSENQLRLFRSTDAGASWTDKGGTIDTANNQSTLTGIASFSRWTIGIDNNPLPVDLLWFKASQKENCILLEWETASETNNQSFIIYKNTEDDAEEWVCSQSGSGNSNTNQYYQAVDPSVSSKITYYKIYQCDYDGTIRLMGISVIESALRTAEVKILPNPAVSTIEIIDAENDLNQYLIVNQAGALMQIGTVYQHQIDINGLAPGCYTLHLISDSKHQTCLFVVK